MLENRVKVLLVISNLEFGGAQRQIVELANNIDRSKYEVHLCSLSSYTPLGDQLKSDVELTVLEKKFKFDFLVVFKLMQYMWNNKISVVHSYLFDAEIASRLACFFYPKSVKMIGSERNANYTIKNVQKKAYQLTKKMVDLIIANSKSGADYNAAALNYDRSKYRVVYNGVDTKKFSPVDTNVSRERFQLPRDVVLIGMFASFKEQKNHPVLLKALSRLESDLPEYRVILVGDMLHGGLHGSDLYYQNMLTMINDYGLEEKITLVGNVDEVECLYPACDFTVLPSLFEGFPNVILESMACGVPVIASNVSDNAILVDDGVDGLLFELGDEEEVVLSGLIRELVVNPDGRRVLGDNSRKSILKNYSTLKLAENTTAVYGELDIQ